MRMSMLKPFDLSEEIASINITSNMGMNVLVIILIQEGKPITNPGHAQKDLYPIPASPFRSPRYPGVPA